MSLDPGLVARVDEVRGDVPRSRWVATAIGEWLEETLPSGPPLSMSEATAAQAVVNEARSQRLAAKAALASDEPHAEIPLPKIAPRRQM